jgi:hypothetical protein
MQNNFWVKMAVLLVSLALMAAVSCSKKAVTMDNGSVPTANEDSYAKSGVEKSSVQEENMDSAASTRAPESGALTNIVLQQDIYFEFEKRRMVESKPRCRHNDRRAL